MSGTAVFELTWRHGRAVLIPTAGMLWSCAFRLPSGRVFQPFARAPWDQDPHAESERSATPLPGHMRRLGGEFVCLPFGADATAPDRPMHGPAADADWSVLAATDTDIVMRLDYPDDDDVAFLVRRVAAVPTAAALDLTLSIHARRDCERTVALHPVLRLPEPPGRLRIAAPFETGLTWPHPEPGTSRLRPGAPFVSLGTVPRADGGAADCADLDLSRPQEELLQLSGMSGPVVVAYPAEASRCVVAWDVSLLPSCLIWISDRMLTTQPWSGRFRGIGIEPAAASIDHPTRGGLALRAGTPIALRYRIAGQDAPAAAWPSDTTAGRQV